MPLTDTTLSTSCGRTAKGIRARVASLTFECRDADELARCWAPFLGLEEACASEDRCSRTQRPILMND